MVKQNVTEKPEEQLEALEAAGDVEAKDLEAEPELIARLKHQAPRDLRIQKQLAIIAVSFVAAFVLLVYLPSMRTLTRLHERLTAGTQMLESNLERGRALPQLRDAANRLEQELAPFKPLPAERALSDVTYEVRRVGAQLSLRGLNQLQQQHLLEDGLGIAPVKLTFEGNFENVYSFIRRCEELPHPVRISEMKIEQKPATATTPLQLGEVRVSMVLDVFFLPETAAGA